MSPSDVVSSPAGPGTPDATRWFAEEILPHEPALRSYLLARFPMLGDVDDQIQETYVRLFRARRSGRATFNRAFLFVVARNMALDLVRRRRAAPFVRTSDIETLASPELAASPAETMDRQWQIKFLEDAIQALPKRCREILTLRRLHNLSHVEIARRLGISAHTVNAQLVIAMSRCRQRLRARLFPRAPGLPLERLDARVGRGKAA